MGNTGRLELDRPIDAIIVGVRHREDLGDIAELATSIGEHGLLQPITLSPDGTLICGRRRLAAVQRLGWTKVNVWIRSGISTQLERLLAEQHENTDRKPYTATEAAALYRELKALITEDAARRQHATQYGDTTGEETSSGVESAPPADRKTRARAARAVTGRNSYTRLEQVGELERLAGDPALPGSVREHAARELEAARTDGKVHRHYAAAKVAAACAELDRIADDPTRPDSARARARADGQRLAEHADSASAKALLVMADNALARTTAPNEPTATTRISAREFLLACQEFHGWIGDSHPDAIAPTFTDEQWGAFEETVAALQAFAAAGRDARAHHTSHRGEDRSARPPETAA